MDSLCETHAWQPEILHHLVGKAELQAGPTYPLGTVLRAHDTCQGPQKRFNIFLNEKKNMKIIITYKTKNSSLYQHSGTLEYFLMEEGAHEGGSAQGPRKS